MIRYCEETQICRSRLLLSYFDEKEFKDCGICEVCIENNKVILTAKKHDSISLKLIQDLCNKELSIKDLVSLNPEIEEEEILNVTQWLLDNEKIKSTKYHKLTSSSKKIN